MRIYFCGLGGVGIGPLALIAKQMGHDVIGSEDDMYPTNAEIEAAGIHVEITKTADYLKESHKESPIDWFVYTAARPEDNPEVVTARSLGIRTSKRDELLAELLETSKLKLIAVAGTHGKTTTTALIVWVMKQLGVPVSYSVGTRISFGDSGSYDPASEYFVYEADEYHRNFLRYKPYASIIPTIGYDHPDIYPSKSDYKDAFAEFIYNSHCTYMWSIDAESVGGLPTACMHSYGSDVDTSIITLAGEHNRKNAWLALQCIKGLFPTLSQTDIVMAINTFPGTSRRFETLIDNLITDYAHHPDEIAATIQMARERNKHVTVVYQPHQNMRQHELKDSYVNAFNGANAVYWLPTYLSREDPNLTILTPKDLIAGLNPKITASEVAMDASLVTTIQKHLDKGNLVLCLSAGSLDSWLRTQFLKAN